MCTAPFNQTIKGLYQKGTNIKYNCEKYDSDNYHSTCSTLCFTQSLQLGNNFWIFGKTSIKNTEKADQLSKF